MVGVIRRKLAARRAAGSLPLPRSSAQFDRFPKKWVHSTGLMIPGTKDALYGLEDCQHAEERAASCRRCVDVLLDDLQMRTCLLDLMGNVGKIAQGAAEPIQLRHNERIA